MNHKIHIKIRQVLSILILACLAACQRDVSLFDIQNLNGNEITILGHGGMGVAYKFPNNSYESLEPVLRIGADGTEIDIQLSKDSVIMAYHHGNLNDDTSCDGVIHDLTRAEMGACKYNSPISSQIYVITLESFFERTVDIRQYTIVLDIKLNTNTTDLPAYFDQFTNAILSLLDKWDMVDRTIIDCADPQFISALQAKRPELRISLVAQNIPAALIQADSMNLFGISTKYNLITREQVDYAHSKGIFITLYNTQTDPQNIEAAMKSPDIIQTDRPIHLLKVFGKYRK